MNRHVATTLIFSVSLLSGLGSCPQLGAQTEPAAEELPPPVSLEEPATATDPTGNQSGILEGTQSILNRQPGRTPESTTRAPDAAGQQRGAPMITPPNLPDSEWIAQGPVHEAFGIPINQSMTVREPKLVAEAPPKRLNEQRPPKPASGKNLQWIDGYWAFDEMREQFVWITGFYREVPPGRTWIASEWYQVEGGYARVPGYWAEAEAAGAAYLPAPPATDGPGPTESSRSADSFWMPGHWQYENGQYAWSDGYWTKRYPDWVWQPACYLWTPQGFVYVSGYWDYEPTLRGIPYAPIVFYRPVYLQPGYSLLPAYPLAAPATLLVHLFVLDSYRGFWWGDFYDTAFQRRGLRPWYVDSDRAYPSVDLASYYRWKFGREGIRFDDAMSQAYAFFMDAPDARPSPLVVANPAISNAVSFDRLIQNVAQGDFRAALNQVTAGPRLQPGPPLGPAATTADWATISGLQSGAATRRQPDVANTESTRRSRRGRNDQPNQWPPAVAPIPGPALPPLGLRRPPGMPVPPGLRPPGLRGLTPPGIGPPGIPPIGPFGRSPADIPRRFGGRGRR